MADTAATTPTETAGGRPPRRLGAALVAASLAVMLLWLALPRLAAALLAVPGQAVVHDLLAGQQPPVADLENAARALATARAWAADGGYDLDRGLVLLRHSQQAATLAEAARLKAASRAATVRGLAEAPVQPSAWLRLANLRQQDGDAIGAGRALRLSLLTGPMVPAILPDRLRLAFALWPMLDDDTRALVPHQIRLAWVLAPAFLSSLTVDAASTARVGEALATLSEEDMALFLRNHRGGP